MQSKHKGRGVKGSQRAHFGQHLPHDRTDEPHNDLIQHVEKLQHQFGLLSHFAHDDSESHKEPNQACNTEFVFQAAPNESVLSKIKLTELMIINTVQYGLVRYNILVPGGNNL